MATKPESAPYGSWNSPITADRIVSGTVRLSAARFDREDIYWVESRPSEGGRSVIVRRTPEGNVSDVTPAHFNARTRVHEYGGGEYTVADGVVYFSNFSDQRVYRQTPGDEPRPITPEAPMRYADAVVDLHFGRLICVREDHTDSDQQAVNSLVAIPLNGQGEQVVLAQGNDFYAAPRLSRDGAHLAWLTWNHPNMPWDGTELWCAEFAPDGSFTSQRQVAGGAQESIFQPEWSPDGTLYFISDRSGWWNLYRLRGGDTEPLYQVDAEFGVPLWRLGLSTYGFVSETQIICTYVNEGIWHLALLDTASGAMTPYRIESTHITSVQAAADRALYIGASATSPEAVYLLDLATARAELIHNSSRHEFDPGYLSVPEAIEFPTTDGQTAHGFFYPPHNKDFTGRRGERPPLLVHVHGGPTSATWSAFSLTTQYWTSRGFAVLDLNYRGSTGYGREYRNRLRGQWGVVDVDDAVNGAHWLAKQGRVDGHRLAIDGGSAGGYTTLAALAFRDAFHAGTSQFGVSDIEALHRETHKFESRYMEYLIGPYPDTQQLFRERSPLHSAARINRPIALFQGRDDKIVPPNQAEMIANVLQSKGTPYAHVTFAGEGHGFRKAENIKRALDGELYFYSKIFGFPLATEVEPVPIANLKGK